MNILIIEENTVYEIEEECVSGADGNEGQERQKKGTGAR